MRILEFLEKKVNGGMTQKKIAEKIGMLPGNFNKIMRGREPELKTIKKIAEAFQVPVSMFLDDETPLKVFTQKELLLLELINGDKELLESAIKHTEKEKLYTEIKKSRAA